MIATKLLLKKAHLQWDRTHGTRVEADPLKREDLDEFVKCYNAENRHNREATWSEKNDPHPNPPPDQGEGKKRNAAPHPGPLDSGSGLRPTSPLHGVVPEGEGTGNEGRWRAYTYDELINLDKLSLDIALLQHFHALAALVHPCTASGSETTH